MNNIICKQLYKVEYFIKKTRLLKVFIDRNIENNSAEARKAREKYVTRLIKGKYNY